MTSLKTAENRTKFVGNKIVNKRRFNKLSTPFINYEIQLLLESVGAFGSYVQTLDSFVFSDEAVFGVSGEVNKRKT